MKIFSLFLLLLITGCTIQSVYIKKDHPARIPPVPTDSIVHSVFLIGDAGEPAANRTEPTFRILTEAASEHPERSTILFLGDNIYQRGLPDDSSSDRPEMERRIGEQIRIGEQSGATAIFIPGNHDWDYQGKEGWNAILRQQKFIDSKNLPSVAMFPKNGLPGPSVIDIGKDIRLVIIDTEWWLHAYAKPFYEGDITESETKKHFLDSLSVVLATKRKVIVAAHHPLETHGEHGGFFDWKDHLFPLRKLVSWMWIPLPGLGSLYPLSRMWGISDQDFSGSKNSEMRNALEAVLSRHDVVAYAAGHEHTLQVMEKRSNHYYLVSGKGIEKHSEALTTEENTIMASGGEGFMRVDFANNGIVRLSVVATGSDKGVEIFSLRLR